MNAKKIVWLALGLGAVAFFATRSKSPSTTGTSNGNILDAGLASWYGPGFDGKLTASGAVFHQEGLSAAHRTMKLGTIVDVTNLENGRTVRVVVNDRGPFTKNASGDFARVLDLSKGAARILGFVDQGLTSVEVRAV